MVAPDALKNQKEAAGVVNKDKLAKAKELAAKLNLTRKAPEEVDIMQQAASAVLKASPRGWDEVTWMLLGVFLRRPWYAGQTVP